jgi:long-chain fatty acid transport protein
LDTSFGVVSNGKDYSFGAGVRVGALYQLNDAVSLGATYQSKNNMSKFDDYALMFPNGGELDIPANYGLGIAFKASDKLDVAFDVTRIEYAKVDATGNAPSLPLFAANAHGFGWDNQTVFKLGFAYKFSSDLTLRAGYNYGKSPIKLSPTNASFNFNTLAPGIVERHLTLGFTKNLGADSSITGYYMHAFNNKATGIFGFDPDDAAAGTLEMSQNAFGLNYNMKF